MLAAFLALILLLVSWRIYLILPSNRPPTPEIRQKRETCSLAIFLGSGGHTTEALKLLSALDFQRYSPRTYIISEGDHLSAQKVIQLEALKSSRSLQKNAQSRTIIVPRARRVHQSLLTTPATALSSIIASVYYVTIQPALSKGSKTSVFSDVLLLNGPGTCFILCLAVYLNKFLGLPAPKIIYVESFARVQSLSLSGKLLRPLVDRFIVQWPHLLSRGRGECHGWLV
ncbi:glycosyltransferase family 1 protein [Amanita thiersii Skay4041]|uniref:UDP-N-acetylglucosamine transferase subunit ALG14 n=1 Tax=Amanita thiersii Skay4041 TaxID=703135 RepID=A0A2A9NTD2_9AGAR|nr:glycosyltransferase family 1 protein [Amanita thiersii Skay4041]